VNGKKIAGVLVEVQQRENRTAVIIGIGLNVNMPQAELAHIPREATSLSCETHQFHDLMFIRQQFIEYFLFNAYSSKEAIFELWKQKISWMIGAKITVQLMRETLLGTIRGFEADGTLILELDDGGIRRVVTGDLI
jgi:BirA family biotin operon repressor/biotin-[acetyl-CoA-carboxylase] ligase